MHHISSFLKEHRQHRDSGATGDEAVAQPAQDSPQQATIQSQQDSSSNRAMNQGVPQGSTLTVALQNQTSSNSVFAYITGRAIDNGNSWVLLQSDAVTPYFPTSPSGIMQPLPVECAIKLGPPGSTVQAQIPHIAGGRIWFSIDRPIQFFLNPGPALVEPSVTNPSDPNAQLDWSFAEFTWNADQLYANISYVDFVGIPVALTLETRSGDKQHISGMNPSGIGQVANELRQQASRDGIGWDKLVVKRPGSDQPLRILSPNQGLVTQPDLFPKYYEQYVHHVYQKFESVPISIDTQAAPGVVSTQVSGDAFDFNGSRFERPSTHDILTCNSGPFTTGANAQTNAIIPRLAAAFNRSTLLLTNDFPEAPDLHYQHDITNHYSRIVHAANLDGKGYAFPYDDVQPTTGTDQSGKVQAGDPAVLTVTVGGSNAYVA